MVQIGDELSPLKLSMNLAAIDERYLSFIHMAVICVRRLSHSSDGISFNYFIYVELYVIIIADVVNSQMIQ